MTFQNIKYILFVGILILGCSQYRQDNILLQIGEYKLTVDDYEKLKVQYQDYSIDRIEKDLVEDGFIMAHSLDNKLDTNSILSKKLEYALQLYTSDVGGYVWNKKIAPLLKVSDKDIIEAFEKRKMEYIIDVIYFSDRLLVDKFVPEKSKIQTQNDFNSLKIKASKDPNIKYFQHQIAYPFHPYGVYTDFFADAKKGDSVGPIETLNGYVVLNIVDYGINKQSEFELVRDDVKNILESNLMEKYIWESQKEIFRSTNPKMNDEAIKLMASKFIVDKKECPGMDKNMTLMEYQFLDKAYTYTVSNFMEYINLTPIYYGLLNNVNDIKNILKSYLIGICLYQEAQEMNAEEDDEYKWYKEQYRRKLFIDYFKNEIVVPPVKEQEMKDYYHENLSSFKNFETAVLNVYKFDDKHTALESWVKIANFYRQNLLSSDLSNSVKYEVDGIAPATMEIQISDSTHDVKLIDHIKKSNESSLLPTVKINEAYWIVYLVKKTGSEILPYRYVKDDIQQILFDKRKSETTNRLISDLKLKYPVKINNFRKYNLENNGR